MGEGFIDQGSTLTEAPSKHESKPPFRFQDFHPGTGFGFRVLQCKGQNLHFVFRVSILAHFSVVEFCSAKIKTSISFSGFDPGTLFGFRVSQREGSHGV